MQIFLYRFRSGHSPAGLALPLDGSYKAANSIFIPRCPERKGASLVFKKVTPQLLNPHLITPLTFLPNETSFSLTRKRFGVLYVLSRLPLLSL